MAGESCTHSSAECDGKCDSCGADFGPTACADSDGDGMCDSCGKAVEVSVGDGINLVSGGKVNFVIVVGSDAMAKNRDSIETLMTKLNARLDGADFEIKPEGQIEEQEIEILIGTVTTRGAEYKLDKYSYGEKGYGIEIIGKKLVVVGGSDTALDSAVKALERDVFGIVKAVEPIVELTLTDSIHKPQDDYKIKSVKIGDTDLNEYVFAIDKSEQAKAFAEKYQSLFYKTLGIRPDIVSISKLTEGQRAIVIENIENGGDRTTEEGFNLYVAENGNLIVECEFPDKLMETAGAVFNKEFLDVKKASLVMSGDYTYKKNIRVITYEDFKAAGNGITDDFAAIKAAHEYANLWGHTVHATKGKVYYIGNKTEGKSITVQTDTYWNGAKFIFDDSGIAVHKSCGCNDCKMRGASIFSIESKVDSVNVSSAVRANLPLLSSFDGVGTQKFENWPLNYTSLVYLNSNERKVFIRMGTNADKGDSLSEVILVHPDGTIDPLTPITWHYTQISYATAYNAEETPLVLDGGGAIVETIANRPENNDYNAFSRNIAVYRSNTKVCNFEHIVQEEQEFRAPYAGILYTTRCHDVTYENIVLQAARRKFVASDNQQGTYEIGAYSANDIKFYNVNVSNFFATGAAYDYEKYGDLHTQGEIGNRGMMGTNYCRNFYFEDCRIVNFDSHKGMGNLTMVNCELQNILIMGAGNILLKNTTHYVDKSRTVVNYRADYGASFRGNVTFDDVEILYSDELYSGNSGATVCLLNVDYNPHNDYDTDLDPETGEQVQGKGSTNYMATNVYVKAITVTKYTRTGYIAKNEDGYNDIEKTTQAGNIPIYVFNKAVGDAYTEDISKFKSNGGYSELNRYIPPELIEITNSYDKIMLPTGITFTAHTKMIVDGEEVNEG